VGFANVAMFPGYQILEKLLESSLKPGTCPSNPRPGFKKFNHYYLVSSADTVPIPDTPNAAQIPVFLEET